MNDNLRAIWYRLSVDCVEGLPDHSKICYTTSLNIFSEFDEEIVKQGGYYDVSHIKKVVCLPNFMNSSDDKESLLLLVRIIRLPSLVY